MAGNGEEELTWIMNKKEETRHEIWKKENFQERVEKENTERNIKHVQRAKNNLSP